MRQKKRKGIIISLLLIITIMLTACTNMSNTASNTNQELISSEKVEAESEKQTEEAQTDEVDNEAAEKETNQATEERDSVEEKDSDELTGDLLVHFIDVGQGDSILIQCGSQTMLIDAGENNMGSTVVDYIKQQGITSLDYVIGTHPHSDHIGGLDTVINAFSVGKVILPDVTNTTQTFEDVLTAISDQGLKITKPVVGDTYSIGQAEVTIIAPNSEEYDDLNDYSVGIRLEYGSTSFVMAGDADAVSEYEMTQNGQNLKADVLKLNHHGSKYSSNEEFIDAVDPTYAIISVGEGNSYGHPNTEVLDLMEEKQIEVYRTDLSGTILVCSDGTTLTIETKGISSDSIITSESDSSSQDEETDDTKIVYYTDTGSKYHKKGCTYLKDSSHETTIEDAKARGLGPCSRCNPGE